MLPIPNMTLNLPYLLIVLKFKVVDHEDKANLHTVP